MTFLSLEHQERTPAGVVPDPPLDERIKGLPAGSAPLFLEEIGDQGWNVLREDLPLPLAILRESAVEHNSDWMRRFLKRSGARIAPHGKTTMSPQLFRHQMNDGAWGITVATVHQLQVCRRFGFSRLLLANQLVGAAAVGYVVREILTDPAVDFYCFVDSVAGVRVLQEAMRETVPGRPLQLLLEVGFPGGRTGVRTLAEAVAVARAVAEDESLLTLRGVSGFEGLIPGDSPADTQTRVTAFLGQVVEIAEKLEDLSLLAPGQVILSAGGSAFYDLVVQRLASARLRPDRLLLVRSGCYLTHDSSMYAEQFRHAMARSPELELLGEGPRAAVELWAYVQSRPEPTRVILGFGKRDCSYDADLPRPISWYRPGSSERPLPLPETNRIVELNDQHAFLEIPEDSPLAFGDMVMLGISHPCTTFDKWQVLMVVDDDYDVVGAVRTYF